MPQLDPATRLMPLVNGYQLTQLVYVVAHLGIADVLEAGPMHVDKLAEATGAHGPSLYRLLRAVSAYGIFTERGGRSFELTPLARCLQRDRPGSVRETILIRGHDYYRTWGELLFSVQTGDPSFKRVFGMSNWEYRRSNPEANSRFNSFVAEMARARAVSVLNHYAFPEKGLAVDIGGGNGTLMIAILNRYPGLRGMVFDVPHVVAETRSHIGRSGLSDRCAAVAGDFFKEVPSGGEFYFLSAVLHDWDDCAALKILRTCAKSMNGASLYIIERMLPGPNEASAALFSDLDMLVNTGGLERDEEAWTSLLQQADFRLESISRTASDFFVLHARPCYRDPLP